MAAEKANVQLAFCSLGSLGTLASGQQESKESPQKAQGTDKHNGNDASALTAGKEEQMEVDESEAGPADAGDDWQVVDEANEEEMVEKESVKKEMDSKVAIKENKAATPVTKAAPVKKVVLFEKAAAVKDAASVKKSAPTKVTATKKIPTNKYAKNKLAAKGSPVKSASTAKGFQPHASKPRISYPNPQLCKNEMTASLKGVGLCNIEMADLSHPTILAALQKCTHFETQFYHVTEDKKPCWKGSLELFMAKDADIAHTIDSVNKLGKDIEMGVISITDRVYESIIKDWNFKAARFDAKLTRKWTSGRPYSRVNICANLLLVTGFERDVDSAAMEACLWQVFPKAHRIVVHLHNRYAYVRYENRAGLLEGMQKNGTRLHDKTLNIYRYKDLVVANLFGPPKGPVTSMVVHSSILKSRSIIKSFLTSDDLTAKEREKLNKKLKVYERYMGPQLCREEDELARSEDEEEAPYRTPKPGKPVPAQGTVGMANRILERARQQSGIQFGPGGRGRPLQPGGRGRFVQPGGRGGLPPPGGRGRMPQPDGPWRPNRPMHMMGPGPLPPGGLVDALQGLLPGPMNMMPNPEVRDIQKQIQDLQGKLNSLQVPPPPPSQSPSLESRRRPPRRSPDIDRSLSRKRTYSHSRPTNARRTPDRRTDDRRDDYTRRPFPDVRSPNNRKDDYERQGPDDRGRGRDSYHDERRVRDVRADYERPSPPNVPLPDHDRRSYQEDRPVHDRREDYERRPSPDVAPRGRDSSSYHEEKRDHPDERRHGSADRRPPLQRSEVQKNPPLEDASELLTQLNKFFEMKKTDKNVDDEYIDAKRRRTSPPAFTPARTQQSEAAQLLVPNAQGLYTLCIQRDPYMKREAVMADFGRYGKIGEVDFTDRAIYLQYTSKNSGLDALEFMGERYKISIPTPRQTAQYHSAPASKPHYDDRSGPYDEHSSSEMYVSPGAQTRGPVGSGPKPSDHGGYGPKRSGPADYGPKSSRPGGYGPKAASPGYGPKSADYGPKSSGPGGYGPKAASPGYGPKSAVPVTAGNDHSGSQAGVQVYIGNLTTDTTMGELRGKLKGYNLKKIALRFKEDRSGAYAYVVLPNQAEANALVQDFNMTPHRFNRLVVKVLDDSPAGRVPKQTTGSYSYDSQGY